MADQPTYRVIWLKNANGYDEQAKLNEMNEKGYEFVQMETVYARTKGVLITKLVFKLHQELAFDDLELEAGDERFASELAAARDYVMPSVDPLLERWGR